MNTGKLITTRSLLFPRSLWHKLNLHSELFRSSSKYVVIVSMLVFLGDHSPLMLPYYPRKCSLVPAITQGMDCAKSTKDNHGSMLEPKSSYCFMSKYGHSLCNLG